MRSTLILEKKLNSGELIISPNNKLNKIKKAKSKNPFHLTIAPFPNHVRQLATGIIFEDQDEHPLPSQNPQKRLLFRYRGEFLKQVRSSDLIQDLTFNKVKIISKIDKKSPPKPRNSGAVQAYRSAFQTALLKISSSIWKNCFLFGGSGPLVDDSYQSRCDFASPLKQFVLKKPGFRVLVLDWGVSHSPDMQSAFYDNPNVLVISIFKHDDCPTHPAPGAKSPSLHSLGAEQGLGFNLNLPLRVDPEEYFEDSRYLFIFERAVFPIIKSFRPDLVVVANSLDVLHGDPRGRLHLAGHSNSSTNSKASSSSSNGS